MKFVESLIVKINILNLSTKQEMIKAIIFDFDGVLVESAHIKTEAFKNVFSKWPEKEEEGVLYHLKNMGISRYRKFQHFYENILGEPYTDTIGEKLGRQFSGIVLDSIKKASLVKGTENFLEKNYFKYLFYIASGTPEQELQQIVSYKGMAKYFRGVFGTPSAKAEITKKILEEYSLNNKDVVFVGDAESDKIAAEETGVDFILRTTLENRKMLDSIKYKIADLTELENIIWMIQQ